MQCADFFLLCFGLLPKLWTLSSIHDIVMHRKQEKKNVALFQPIHMHYKRAKPRVWLEESVRTEVEEWNRTSSKTHLHRIQREYYKDTFSILLWRKWMMLFESFANEILLDLIIRIFWDHTSISRFSQPQNWLWHVTLQILSSVSFRFSMYI